MLFVYRNIFSCRLLTVQLRAQLARDNIHRIYTSRARNCDGTLLKSRNKATNLSRDGILQELNLPIGTISFSEGLLSSIETKTSFPFTPGWDFISKECNFDGVRSHHDLLKSDVILQRDQQVKI